MIAEVALWQWLLDTIGRVVAAIYDLVPNYGVTIIVLTVLIRMVLLPLGIRQIRSMQAMQIVQPELRKIQTKYKGNRAKQQEETMRLYKEHGVNPFSGCWPVLLQFPILISMYSVLRHPQHPPHLPVGSALRTQIEVQIPPTGPGSSAPDPSGTAFLGMNLLCAPNQAGTGTATLRDPAIKDENGDPIGYPVDCGNGIPARVPYYAFAAVMFLTTYYQQRQMQQATPSNAASDQQQAVMKIMPLMFGVFGFFFPAGLVLYWSTSNLWQIGQQYFMLRNRPTAESMRANADRAKGKGRNAGKGSAAPAKKGFMQRMMEQAEEQQRLRDEGKDPKGGGGRG